jgi:hypothetical protein
MSSLLKKALVCLISVGFIVVHSLSVMAQAPEQAQPDVIAGRPQPPMENVFFNVLWGSLTGGMLVMGWATLDDNKSTDERYTVNYLTSQFLSGATYGGLIGLIAGVYISFKGITFDENRAKLAILQPPIRNYLPTGQDRERFKTIDLQAVHLLDFEYRF